MLQSSRPEVFFSFRLPSGGTTTRKERKKMKKLMMMAAAKGDFPGKYSPSPLALCEKMW
jgi:hypothetical protein